MTKFKLYGACPIIHSASTVTMTQIEGRAFGNDTEGYYNVETICVPDDVSSIVWNGIGRLHFSHFMVEPKNKVFQAIDGVLYTKKGYDRHGCTRRKHMIELVACPTLIEKHDVVSGTKRIANCAFKECAIKVLTLPEGLEEIGINAFYMANELRSIIVPQTIRRIEPQSYVSFNQVIYDNNIFDSWQKFLDFLLSNGFETKKGNIIRSR